MRNLLALVGLAVVIFAVVGWYCGWYTVSVNRESGGNLQINTKVNTDKVTTDSSAFFQKVGELVGERGEKGQAAPAPQAPDTNAPTQGNSTSGTGLLSPTRPAGVGK
ncbi:MAG TPA: hypothetical protein VLM40_07545 [Gemmata sp.]|nr:hypothetical protein [Gemmata sp.]